MDKEDLRLMLALIAVLAVVALTIATAYWAADVLWLIDH